MSGDVDKAIDRAVREMLDAEPRADLRARVVARIDAQSSSLQPPAAGFQLPAFSFGFAAVSAAAALVVLVLVLVLERRAEPPAQAPVIARTGTQQPAATRPSAQPTDQRATPIDVSAATAQGHLAPGVRAALVTAAVTAPDEQTSAIEPLGTITPIDMAPIAQSSIAPGPIAVRPLTTITDMQIAPLSPPDGRN
jgi:hypothetical protein